MEASIQQVARLAGTTSRTLRHYDAIGLLSPRRVGAGGYRWYGQDELVRLQRILLLRELGLALPVIRDVLDRETDEGTALRGHLDWLHAERERLDRRIASVERTLTARETGGRLMAEDMLDGFDHTQYREEVEQRWGADAYAQGDRWWRSLSQGEREVWQADAARLGADWADAATRGVDPASAEAEALVARHLAWLGSIPGTPRDASGAPDPAYVRGLGDLYVADPRFAKGYGGEAGAAFVRDALQQHVPA